VLPAGKISPVSSASTRLDRFTLAALGVGGLAAVLMVLPYRAFELDRFFVPKELALHATAVIAGVVALARARRLALTRADLLLLAWLGLSFLSTLFAGNHWLAVRAFALSFSAAVVYWSARQLAVAELGEALAGVLAAVVVVGALTALAQAYGFKMEFASLNRAPGGTFGNRNFMAHLSAVGLPLLLYGVAASRKWRTAALLVTGLAICAGALVLSRTRAAWLALMIWGLVTVVLAARGPTLIVGKTARRRLQVAFGAMLTAMVLALLIPNALDWKSDNPYLDSVKGVMNYRDGSGRGRLTQYRHSLAMTAAHPVLGVGPGNWPVAYPRFAPAGDPSLIEESGMTANPWPSSDWVAAMSERGPLAALALAGTLALLFGAALRRRFDVDATSAERLAALCGTGVLGIAVLEGAFDAVLLLPPPALVVWAAVGALVPAGRVVRQVDFTKAQRRWLQLLVLAGGVSFVVLSARKIQAMNIYTNGGTTAALDEAAKLDPGSYRIRMRAADAWLGRGICAKARPHALAARDLFPNAPAPKRLLAQCPGKE
jgi:O-antigen ligase